MVKVREARRGDVRIGYELRGTWHPRRPWLMLIQGMGFDRHGWGPLLPELGRHFRLVLVDNRGSGRTELPASRLRVADMADDACAVLGHAGIAAAHVLGASLGGLIAQELAIRHPQRVRRLVLACTGPGWPLAYPMPAGTVRLLAATGRMSRDESMRRHAENALAPRSAAERDAVVGQLAQLRRDYPQDRRAWLAQAAAGARWAGRGRQARIRASTLVLHGTADAIVDPRNARLLAARIADAELVMFPELGHLLFWQEPKRFAAAVTAFLTAEPGRDQPAGAGTRLAAAAPPAG
ncbi:MAG: alpha/beta fold hydrolase [Streptosporangiaceae bacterium]